MGFTHKGNLFLHYSFKAVLSSLGKKESEGEVNGKEDNHTYDCKSYP